MPRDVDPWYGHLMSDAEAAAFLNTQATGVLSLAQDGRAYGIPMSFAYDEANTRVVMDMGFAQASKKRAFLEKTDEATLTTYDWESPTNWASAIVTGSIRRIPEEDVDGSTVSWYQSIASDIDVVGSVAELAWVELVVDELTGVAIYD